MLLSLDLGSRHCGIVLLEDALPARVAASKKLDVDPADLDPTARFIIGAVDLAVRTSKDQNAPPPRIIIEWGRFYVPPKETPARTAAAGAAMGEARDPMICLRDRVEQHCKARGVAVLRIPAGTWRSRIGCKGRDDAAVSVALATHTALDELPTEHERDAAGAAIGVLIGERDRIAPKAPGAKRVRINDRTRAKRAHDAALDAVLEEAQAAAAALPPIEDVRVWREHRCAHKPPTTRPACPRCGGPHQRGPCPRMLLAKRAQ